MATKKSAPKFGTAEWRKLHPRKPKAAEPKKQEEQFVTKHDLENFKNELTAGVAEAIQALMPKPETVNSAIPQAAQQHLQNEAAHQAQTVPPAHVETPAEASVRKAGANQIPMNPEWEDRAREIIGDAVDHCEIQYLKNGGVIFTVVIKKEMSNERTDYLNYYGSDRRSKEIGSEGVEGVDNWCKLIKSNLARPKPLSDR